MTGFYACNRDGLVGQRLDDISQPYVGFIKSLHKDLSLRRPLSLEGVEQCIKFRDGNGMTCSRKLGGRVLDGTLPCPAAPLVVKNLSKDFAIRRRERQGS